MTQAGFDMEVEGEKVKILVADDDLKNRKLLRVLLRGCGYEIIEAENGEEAVRLAKDLHPGLILMDIRMPVLDGAAALRAIRAEESTKDIPVAALTASVMKGSKERLIGEGFDDYIGKPIDMGSFIYDVKKLLGKIAG